MDWYLLAHCFLAGMFVCLWWQINELVTEEIAYWILSRKRRREHQRTEEQLATLKADLERHEAEQTTPDTVTDKTRDAG